MCVFILFPSFSFAQNQGSEANPNMVEKYGPRRQISTIVYMGLAGAVLGLSTLSFYGRPQDKLTNIPIGFGVGVVLGTIYMTYQAATNPNEFYKETSLQPEYKPDFSDKKIEESMASDFLNQQKTVQKVSYSWSF